MTYLEIGSFQEHECSGSIIRKRTGSLCRVARVSKSGHTEIRSPTRGIGRVGTWRDIGWTKSRA